MSTRQNLLLTFLAVLFLALPASAQGFEIGVKVGSSAYSGDLSPRGFGLFVEDMEFAAGGYLRYRINRRFSVRANGNFGKLSGDRDDLSGKNENEEFVLISRNFRSQLSEFNLVGEYDFLHLGDPLGNHTALYIFGGAGVMSYNPETEIDGEFVEVQPLRTEGQGLDPERYAAAPYELTRLVGVLGGGMRFRFADRIVIGLEIGTRFTGHDYLDDVSDTQVRYLDILGGPGGPLAARISNPAVENPVEAGELQYKRGGKFDDYYFVGGLTVGITLGEGGSNKSGCYNF